MREKTHNFIWLLVCVLVAIPVFSASVSAAQKVSLVEAERKLQLLGYWITKADGRADASTRHALTAFQKVEGLKRTGVLTASVMAALRAADRPAARHSGGPHVEIDLTRQVLFVVNEEGIVSFILPVSSGNEQKYFDKGFWQIAHTPRGDFHVTRKINGLRTSTLGNLYYPSYFYGGIAVHGSGSIPVKPASHGCVRVPRTADKILFKLMPVGMPVYVYD